MATDTREQMILTAARLFQRDGYHATSWRRLVEEAGTPWGSIHHHFPGGKDELGVAAVEAGRDAVLTLIDHCFTTNDDPGDAVGQWFVLSTRLVVGTSYEAGCPVATVALETVAAPGPLKDATMTAFTSWERRIAHHLRRAGIRRADAADAAISVLVLLEGAMLLARVHGRAAPMKAASRHAQAIVAEALAASAVG